MTTKASPLLLLVPLVVSAALTARAAAPDATPIPLRLSVQEKAVTRDAQGRTRVTWQSLAPAGVRSGDVLRYTLVGENHAGQPVRGLTLTQPVTVGTTLVPRSTSGNAQVTYSVDNGHTFSAAPVIPVVSAGAVQTVPAPPEAYTDVRWTLTGAVAPGATVRVSYEVQVR